MTELKGCVGRAIKVFAESRVNVTKSNIQARFNILDYRKKEKNWKSSVAPEMKKCKMLKVLAICDHDYHETSPHPVFNCSKLRIETLKQSVKYVQS